MSFTLLMNYNKTKIISRVLVLEVLSSLQLRVNTRTYIEGHYHNSAFTHTGNKITRFFYNVLSIMKDYFAGFKTASILCYHHH
jgi:hypothetical protein